MQYHATGPSKLLYKFNVIELTSSVFLLLELYIDFKVQKEDEVYDIKRFLKLLN